MAESKNISLDKQEPYLSQFREAWKLRVSDRNGSNEITYYTPHELMEAFYDYTEWVESHPLYEAVIQQKTGDIIDVPKMRAMTIRGFCLFIGIAQTTFNGYEKKPGFKHITAAIKDAIYTQKFEGAAAGLLNSNLIQRDLGLNDTVNHNLIDDRKSVDELFPAIEDIECVIIKETKELPYE